MSDVTESRRTTGVALKRPRDRKTHIILAATDLFHDVGYHGVSMDDIASAVGITAGALYRHFRSKQDLLFAVIHGAITALHESTDAVAEDDLAGLCRAMIHHMLTHRRGSPLFQQEARNLTEEQNAARRAQLRAIELRIARGVRAIRGDLPKRDVELLSWALLSVIGSPSRHRTALPQRKFEALLLDACERLWTTARLPSPKTAEPRRRPGLTPSSRREALLSTAVKLFNERGYQAVTMEEIAAASGVVASSIYNHYAGKLELLTAAFNRGGELLRLHLAQGLAAADSPTDALRNLIRSYVDLALAPDSVVGLLVTEVGHLPTDQRHRLRRGQREHVDEWARLLDAEPAEARALVHAALTLINDLSRTPSVRKRRNVASDLCGLASMVLGID